MEKLFGLLLLIMLAPALLCALVQVLCCLVQITVSTLAVLLPWALLFGLVIALGAGIGAGLTLRDRLPPRPGGEFPPSPGAVVPVRRAPEIANEEDEE